MEGAIKTIKRRIRAREKRNAARTRAKLPPAPTTNTVCKASAQPDVESGHAIPQSATPEELLIPGIAQYQKMARWRAYNGFYKVATSPSTSASVNAPASASNVSLPTVPCFDQEFNTCSSPLPKMPETSSIPIEVVYKVANTMDTPPVSRRSWVQREKRKGTKKRMTTPSVI